MLFSTQNQKLERIDDEEIAGFARNYIHATFVFDEPWIELKKYALFMSPNEDRYVVKLGYGKELSCKVPDDILKNVFFKVSVFAGDLLTSTQETIMISPSGYTEAIDNITEDEVLEGEVEDIIIYNQKHYDEECDGRHNRFEIAEHPYI